MRIVFILLLAGLCACTTPPPQKKKHLPAGNALFLPMSKHSAIPPSTDQKIIDSMTGQEQLYIDNLSQEDFERDRKESEK